MGGYCSSSGHAVCAVGLPVNASTQRHYSGINILILWGAVFDREFASQSWLTFKQTKVLGGTVRKGEHGQVSAMQTASHRGNGMDGPHPASCVP